MLSKEDLLDRAITAYREQRLSAAIELLNDALERWSKGSVRKYLTQSGASDVARWFLPEPA